MIEKNEVKLVHRNWH